jgi:hypothetical protein
MRSQLPTLELDAVFEAKEELALAVKNALLDTMTTYGYQIVQVRSTILFVGTFSLIIQRFSHLFL